MVGNLKILFWGRSLIVQKLAILAALFICTIGGILFYTIVTLQDQKSDAMVVDMAGRQRMLNQRHMKEILLVSRGISADYTYTRKVLSETLEALTNGGPAVLTLGRDETVQLPPAPTEDIKEKLALQKKLIREFAVEADGFLRLSVGDPAYSSQLEELLTLNARVQDVANDAVKLFAEHSESKIAAMIRWEATIGLFAGILAILLTRQVIQANQALENEIGERKRAEAGLRESEAQRMAALQQSDALKSALLSSVSHELRTPLTTIKASVANLFDNADRMSPEMRAEFLAEIHKEIDYLDRLVNNLLDMSRIEAGALVPQREWYPFEDLLEGAIRSMGRPLQERPLDVALADDLPSVNVDGVELQQVLVNLLDNAIKYSPSGSPIRIEVKQGQREIEVRVSNSGEGIPPEDLVRVFDRFHRVRTKHARAIPGTGLGLAICKGLIEAHGGRIWAESVPRETTAFTFTLPTTESMPSFSFERPHPMPRAS